MKPLTVCVALALLPSATIAQRRGEFGGFGGYGNQNEFYMPRMWAGNNPYDGRFTFARIMYRGTGQGVGWSHDYPRAESHFMRIMRQITTIHPFVESGPIVGGNIISLDDPDLFKYPVAYLSEPGGWLPTDKEVEGLRNYLLKGGFVIVDDFDGGNMNNDMMQFQAMMRRVLPKARLMDAPRNHPIFDSFFKIDFEKLTAYRTGDIPQYFAYFQDNDPKKRLMMIVNFNQDIGDYWEWSDRGFNIVPSNEAYKLGVNYIIYALTH
jgi:hypothetical protein